MKEKTSITLSSDLLAEVDKTAGSRGSRSAFIEGVLREYFKENVRQAINQRDLQLINAKTYFGTRRLSNSLRKIETLCVEESSTGFTIRRATRRSIGRSSS
jgi:metal-responsive CopG/Arc/MetJ family transcriptional regulator